MGVLSLKEQVYVLDQLLLSTQQQQQVPIRIFIKYYYITIRGEFAKKMGDPIKRNKNIKITVPNSS